MVLQSANILWKSKKPMAAGVFPPDHPCIADPEGLKQFKAKGYWANPFPEGDGITLDVQGRPAEQVIADIEECFGWEVRKGLPS